MRHGIAGIDHPVIAVRNLDAAKTAYVRLGFTVTARGSHPAWGTGNFCVMFERNYLELRGVVRPTDHTRNLERFLAEREGLMGVALGTADTESTFSSLVSSGLHPKSVHRLSRDFELPEGTTHPSFVLSFLEEDEVPGLMSVVLCQHLTPELIRRADWMRHANGALGVRCMTAVVEDLGLAAEAYRRLFGDGAVSLSDTGVSVRAGSHSSFFLSTMRQFERDFPGGLPYRAIPPPFLAAVTLDAGDLRVTRACLEAGGVRWVDDSDRRLIVHPADTCGVILEFRRAE